MNTPAIGITTNGITARLTLLRNPVDPEIATEIHRFKPPQILQPTTLIAIIQPSSALLSYLDDEPETPGVHRYQARNFKPNEPWGPVSTTAAILITAPAHKRRRKPSL
jgi:hypothetical protein